MTASRKLDASSRVARVPGVHERKVGGKVFLVMPDGTMHVLDNATALDVWSRVASAGDEGAAVEDLARGLVEAFQVGLPDASRDVLAFVTTLVAGGALEVESVGRD